MSNFLPEHPMQTKSMVLVYIVRKSNSASLISESIHTIGIEHRVQSLMMTTKNIILQQKDITVLVTAPVSCVKLDRFKPGSQRLFQSASQRSDASFTVPRSCFLSTAAAAASSEPSSDCSLLTCDFGCSCSIRL